MAIDDFVNFGKGRVSNYRYRFGYRSESHDTGKVKAFSVAILDEDLGDGTGKEVADLLREKQIPIGIIGLAHGKTPWADISINKSGLNELGFDKNELLAAMAKILLPAKPFG